MSPGFSLATVRGQTLTFGSRVVSEASAKKAGGSCGFTQTPPLPLALVQSENKCLVSTGRAGQCSGGGQTEACLDWPFQRPRPCITRAGRFQECCHPSPLLYPEAGVDTIAECLLSPAGGPGLQHPAEGGLPPHAVPLEQAGRKGCWLGQTNFTDDGK